MVILGLTGSIGMGKSTTANMFRQLRVPVYESDNVVHRLLGPGGAAVPAVRAAFPNVIIDDAVDRAGLGKHVFGNPTALTTLEGIVHPLVRAAQAQFLRRAAARRERLVVLDIPLLFETGGDGRCDATLVVSAPRFVQEMRVLSRPEMTRAKLDGILDRQMADREKRVRADFVVPSGRGRALTLRRIKEIVRLLKRREGTKWPPSSYAPARSPYARNCSRYRDDRARSERRPPHR